jgi:hypothetical protein
MRKIIGTAAAAAAILALALPATASAAGNRQGLNAKSQVTDVSSRNRHWHHHWGHFRHHHWGRRFYRYPRYGYYGAYAYDPYPYYYRHSYGPGVSLRFGW